ICGFFFRRVPTGARLKGDTLKLEVYTILGVSLDRKKEPWLAAIEKDQLAWTHVSDLKDWKSDAAVQYAIRWIPMNFLLDPNGVILAVGLEGEALQQKLDEVLK
ncbi:thioredoxin-like domain-containing protein, partial [Phocaeicola vulgatus]|nr:thioredoxin-like domain-containing protein [Phocaeicola vulgatus]